VSIEVRDFEAADHEWADRLIGGFQGGNRMVARLGELIDPLTRDGVVAEVDGRRAALLTVTESDRGLEVLTLGSEVRGVGAGTRLLETALRVAAASGMERLWLVTTNDNLDAIAWYLRRGMRVAAVQDGAVDRDRAALKPDLPAVNPDNGVPIRDLVELELRVADGEDLRFRRFPQLEDLNALPPEAAAHLLQPLFEDAPRFLARLAGERPFASDADLVEKAHELARGLPEVEQIELLDAHPRIGADPAGVSDLSRAEQGHDEADLPDAEPWVAEELEALNDAYERIFGFRFVIFVAGRPRSAIVPILEISLRDERISELRRGLDDVVYIAADRLAKLRG
jgi:2-oxo-4-hydroxy-4-carboxy--5-ureidoimidazoline (OHCU) decarboxylase/N-acetylglutamate synthase-like GNAT family acetyltransferase